MEMRLDLRFLSLFLVIFVFLVVLEASAQNFYPSRYGKRGDRVSQAEERFLRGSRYERRSGYDTFYGSRYGKRSSSKKSSGNGHESHSFKSGEYLPANSVEYGTPVLRDRFERSPESRNRFYFGPRFGKRDGSYSGQNEGQHVPCRHAGGRDSFDCLDQVF